MSSTFTEVKPALVKYLDTMSGRARTIQAIRKSAKRRKKAERKRREAMGELRDLCLRGKEAGIPLTELAREAGLSRQGIYDLLGHT